MKLLRNLALVAAVAMIALALCTPASFAEVNGDGVLSDEEASESSIGGGIRYATLIGVLRLDIAGRIPGVQVVAGEDQRFPGIDQNEVNLGYARFPGAIHFSIGEPF